MNDLKSILVTGSKGQLGSTLTKLQHKYKFFFFTKKKFDITDKVKVYKIITKIKPKIIINTAAYTNVNNSEKNYDLAKKINFNGVKNLVTICKKLDILLIHISTDYVFYGNKKLSYSENDKAIPKNKYGKSKLLGENYIKRKLDKYFIFRVSWLFGYGKNNFVYKIFKLIKKNQYLKVVDNEYSSPTSAEDLVNLLDIIILKYTNRSKLKYGLYHFNSFNKKISRYDFALMIKKSLKTKKNSQKKIDKIINKNSFRPINSFLNTRKIYSQFKLKKINFNASLNNMINYYIKNEMK